MTTTAEPTYRVIGTRPIRPDGVDKVTGKANYGADIQLPRMLYARLKKSPHAHAIIKKIDASKALALPGVEAVVVGTDFPNVEMDSPGGATRRFLVGNFMAIDKALFFGHAVAAVAATSIHVAEDALDLIEVEYEVLPPVMTAEQSMSPDAAILHPHLRTAEPTGTPANADSDKPTNIASHIQVAMGDVDAAFAEADHIVEDEFHTGTTHQGYIEPHTATVEWKPDGSLVIYSSSQGQFTAVREPMANILQMPNSKIRVIGLEIGGGFGGKNRIYCEPIAALLAKKAGKPVKLSMTREEVITSTGPTAGTYIRAKMGVKDGKITAAQLWMAYEAGAFPGSSMGGGANHAFGNYDVPNVKIDAYDVVVNRPRNAAYRAPGVPAPTYVCESLVDELAEQLDMDPMDFRLQNASKEGDRRPNGMVLPISGNIPVMQAVKDSAHYRSELTGANRGRGVAMGFWHANSGVHSINANVHSDGTVLVNGGAMDIGGLRATEAMTMAEVLGLPYEDIRVRTVDTDSIGFTGGTGGSGTGSGTAASVWKAGNEIKQKLVERTAKIWEVKPEEVTYEADASFTGPADAEGKPRTMTFKQLAGQLQGTGGPVSGHADFGGGTRTPTYAGHIVDVEVDPDTGKVTILRYTTVTEVGRAMHPGYVEGQIQGGAVQGIGMSLTEEYFYDDQGVLRNNSLLDYRMPTALDVPMIDTIVLEVPHPGHPMGVRGVGEIPLVPPLGAIANAIHDATGFRPRRLPVTPRLLVEELMDRNGEKGGAAAS